MRKYKLIFYSLTLLLVLTFLISGITYWINKPIWLSPCHKQNDTLPLERLWTQYPDWHRYTCETSWSLVWYCKNASKSESDRSSNASCWYSRLHCHICKCAEWMATDIQWQCCKIGNTDKNWVCCSERLIPNENWECVKDEPTSITPIWPGQLWSTTNQTTLNNNQIDCPKDSKWNCCKKMYYDLELEKEVCCEWILLNTNVPFIWQCIVYRKTDEPQPEAWLVVDETNAFPVLMWWLSKIMVSIILLSSFIGLLVAGVIISASGSSEDWAKYWRKIIGNIISALAILGASGVILRLINPNFFW